MLKICYLENNDKVEVYAETEKAALLLFSRLSVDDVPVYILEDGKVTHKANLDKIKKEEEWEWCVSTASSYLSTNWTENFFYTEQEALEFYKASKKKGLAALMVSKEEY